MVMQRDIATDRVHAICKRNLPNVLKVGVLAFLLVAVSFWLQGDVLIGLADEGFLWYGAWRTGLGDIPIRDFHAYDPGRYYWIAVWSKVFGNGIIGLRASVAIFQVLGLTFGLLVLRRVIRPWWLLAVTGVLLLMWMHPRHKLFEHSIAMAAVYFGVLLIENPSSWRHFGAGVFVGLSAFFGRNHGLYLSLSFFLLILFVWFKIDRAHIFRRISVWGTGMSVGYTPMWLMLMVIPGFLDGVEKSAILMLRNLDGLPLPVPWPWRVDFVYMDGIDMARAFSTGMFFLILPLFYLSAGVFLIGSKGDVLRERAPLVAAVFVGATYAHHVFGRAGLGHLAQGIHPLLIGLIVLPFVFKDRCKRVLGAGLLGVVYMMSYFAVGTASPLYRMAFAGEGSFVIVDIQGDNIYLPQATGRLIQNVMRIDREKVDPDKGLLIAPYWPGFYAILQRQSPLWQTYFLFQETEAGQRQAISDLKEKDVDWVILGDVAMDGRDAQRFQNTHGLVWRYLMDAFVPVEVDGLPEDYQLLKRKE